MKTGGIEYGKGKETKQQLKAELETVTLNDCVLKDVTGGFGATFTGGVGDDCDISDGKSGGLPIQDPTGKL